MSAPEQTGADRDRRITELFDSHYQGLCRLATLLLGERDGAEEVVQEAFSRTFAGWWRLRDPDRAQFYLRRAVVNLSRSRLRRRAHEERGNRVVWSELCRGDVPATERTGEVLAVLEAVSDLPPRQREAVVLRYYADLSDKDVARAMGCSVGTVKSQLSKARSTLARRLDENLEPGAPPGKLRVVEGGGSGG